MNDHKVNRCVEVSLSQEWLIAFQDTKTADGVMPGFLFRVTTWQERKNALATGGTDVSNDSASWRAYERMLNEYDECLS